MTLIKKALDQVLEEQEFGQVQAVLGSGEGEFLIDQIFNNHTVFKNSSYTKLSEIISGKNSQAACAYAIARLGAERILF